jgi:putative tricarboxylic transport membrane protein
MNRDILGGAVLLAVAVAYYAATIEIPESSLSDEVGAQGLPRILAALLAVLALSIIARGWWTARRDPRGGAAAAEGDASAPRALGLLTIAAGYVLIAPLVGFAPALALLIAAVATYEGMRPSWRMAVVAVAGAVVFWLLFVLLLGVEQPRSIFF